MRITIDTVALEALIRFTFLLATESPRRLQNLGAYGATFCLARGLLHEMPAAPLDCALAVVTALQDFAREAGLHAGGPLVHGLDSLERLFQSGGISVIGFSRGIDAAVASTITQDEAQLRGDIDRE